MANRTHIDLSGRPFGHLTVVGRSGRRDSSNEVMWRCRCGAEREVYGPSLTGCRSRCCGAAACRAALKEEN